MSTIEKLRENNLIQNSKLKTQNWSRRAARELDKRIMALPIVIVDREDATHDVEFWRTKTPEERLDAVEFLREQCYLAMGIQEAPRLVRELRVVEKQ